MPTPTFFPANVSNSGEFADHALCVGGGGDLYMYMHTHNKNMLITGLGFHSPISIVHIH